ncbi:MAG TPA: hypothetical protein VNQ81_07570 [Povalibacter sp.]|nr:hypothetical protein [Povalibacter sp.]
MNHGSSLPRRQLARFGSILVTGAAAREYLQGQLSFDMSRLTPQRVELASCNSSQGRVQAVLWMVERSDAFVLILPAAMIERTLARLRKYVLRSKVKVESGSERFAAYDATSLSLAGVSMPESTGVHVEHDALSLIRWPGTNRILMLAPADASAEPDPAVEHAWRLEDIRAGLPQVYPESHELFVAQMLNIDLLGGISFEKGCYTGQEIIARAHFRGTVKRRMFRFRASCPAPSPGTRVVVDGAHAGDVVDAVATPDGCELLAVISLAQLNSPLALADVPSSSLTRLELPYAVG